MLTKKGPRIGIFVCECGGNIGDTVDAEAIVGTVRKWDEVAVASYDQYLCSKPAQDMIAEAIEKHGLDRVIVASCTPRMHLPTFQSVLERAGLNPYMLEFVNIREQCSFVHGSHGPHKSLAATRKAISVIRGGYERSFELEPLEAISKKCSRDILIAGGGIAGIVASLELGNLGHQVYLVERDVSIGGNMAKLTKVFPTLDCAQCILAPRMAEVGRNPNIKLLTNTDVEDVSGSPGDFLVKVKRKRRFVDEEKCTGCNKCVEVCPIDMPDEFNMGRGKRRAIYRPFPQAVPSVFAIDKKGISPCRMSCPAGVNAQGYVALISQGKFEEALELVRRDLPFPSVCGRVCFRPCEAECQRATVDEPIAIGALKRFIADYEHNEKRQKPTPIPRTREEPIAVVGSGPAGLTAAYELVRKGYPVTVLEALPEPGGMLRVGIPEYRLPKSVLNTEIEYLRDLGIEITTNVLVGKDVTIDRLLQDGYKAVFVAVGAQRSAILGVEGEESSRVIHALDFLRDVNLGEKVDLGERVAVIGGGNVATDSARTAMRLGAKEVHILYRRSREEMPAYRPEVEEAEREGVKIQFLVTPTRILGEDGMVSAVECVRMELGEPDEGGRRRPMPIAGSEHVMEFDTVIVAIGQRLDFSLLPREVRSDGRIIVADPVTLETSVPRVFAGGDAVLGPATVIDAIASGKRASVSIDRYLRGEDPRAGREREVDRVKEVPTEGIERKARQVMPVLNPDQRRGNFSEVELGFTQEMAIEEAKRCLFCGGCCECLQCETVCENESIIHQQEEECIDIKVGSVILATGYDLFDAGKLKDYGYGIYTDVITMMDLERLISLSGPTRGSVERSNGDSVRKLAIVLCAGSRDANFIPYCSRICCTYSLKQAVVLKEMIGIDVRVFYIDMRAAGRGYEELYWRAQKAGVVFIRGKVAEVWKNNNGKLVVSAEDTLSGSIVEEEFDLVALATPMVPPHGLEELAGKMMIPLGEDGFVQERHPKLDPVDSLKTGIFACGCALGPKDVRDTVADALGAAARAASFLIGDYVTTSPEKAFVRSELCDGCGECLQVCPFNAITLEGGKAKIDPFVCTGWGACIPQCPREAIDLKNSTEKQIIASLKGILYGEEPDEIKIVAFVDKTVGYTGLDFLGLDRVKYPPSVRVVMLPSTAVLGMKHLLHAFAFGANGVIVIEGQEYIDKHFAKERIMALRPLLAQSGIERMRVRYTYLPLPSYRKGGDILNRFVQHIERYGGQLSKETRDNIKRQLGIQA